MSPTDSQPKSTPPPSGSASEARTSLSSTLADIPTLARLFLETLLSPLLDPSSWTHPPSPSDGFQRPSGGDSGNRLGGGGGGGGGGSWYGTGGSGSSGGRGSGGGAGRRLGTIASLNGSGTLDGCRGTCG